jgi:hypothetical protein
MNNCKDVLRCRLGPAEKKIKTDNVLGWIKVQLTVMDAQGRRMACIHQHPTGDNRDTVGGGTMKYLPEETIACTFLEVAKDITGIT